MVRIIEILGEGTWYRGMCNGKEGIFPAEYVPDIPASWNIPITAPDTLTGTHKSLNHRAVLSSSNGLELVLSCSCLSHFTLTPSQSIHSMPCLVIPIYPGTVGDSSSDSDDDSALRSNQYPGEHGPAEVHWVVLISIRSSVST